MASNNPNKDPALKSLCQQFCSITGATEDVGRSLLEACNGNLEMAIGMHMDGGGQLPAANPDGASTSAASPPHNSMPDDEVRAPIPQRTEVLVEEGYNFGMRGRRQQTRRSVFDGFRDFQAEARQQELALSGEKSSRKRKTLEDLFRPPIDLMHKGSFHSARDAGADANKWLMVNIQNVQEFSCQTLNRDVWSNSTIKSMIQGRFIFWQVYHDSEEGQRYTQFYKVSQWPYVAVLDPRTGENLVVWDKIDTASFAELLTEFLSEHPAPDGSSTSLEPPSCKKIKKSDSIVDASEDSQLEAAIQASLKQSEATDVDSGDESSELETFSDSEDDNCNSPLKKETKNKNVLATETKQSVLNSNNHTTSPTKHSTGGACLKDRSSPTMNSHRLSDCATNSGNGTKCQDKTEDTENNKPKSNANHTNEGGETSSNTQCKWKEYIGNEEDPCSNLMIRFPDGKKKQLSVPCSSKLMALVKFVIEEGYSNERYELITNFPRRKLSYLDFDSTLKDIGLFPQDTVFVQER